ncbi:MAG: nucleotidyl transferase AbiEii/AbiGii toxin family protein [Planctomycetota bacterium]
MTGRPTRDTAAGRAYLDLRALARKHRRPTAELLQLYALEGFLARLQRSPQAHRFVLKGGVLLAAFDARRPTKDIDLAATGLANDTEGVRAAIQSVLRLQPAVADGLDFDPSSAKAQVIREVDEYSGVRVSVSCRLASARLDFHVDVNVGDPIRPAPSKVSIPRILGGEPLAVTGYPMSMVLAEKIVTAIQRGSANTRWRDFADVYVLSRCHPLEAADLTQALQTVAEHRLVALQPLRGLLSDFATPAQPRWAAWRRRLQLEDQLQASFMSLLEDLFDFVDPLLTSEGVGVDATWNPVAATWERRTVNEPNEP